MTKTILAACSLLLAGAIASQAASAYNIDGRTPPLRPGSAASLPAGPRMSPPAPRGDALSPFGIGFLPPVQFPPAGWDVFIARVSVFWAINHNVSFFDVAGLGTQTTGDLSGFQVAGIWNQTGGNVTGVQAAGIFNWGGNDMTGIQIAGIANYLDGNGVFSGLQVACIANVVGRGTGLQIGLVNVADDLTGVQIGLANAARNLTGVQIGLGNYVADSTIPFLPILNIGF
jgi:hypothetical protein